MRRAILGGTFDPPHLAHLFAGEAAYRQLEVDVVTFIPAGDPWQKAGRDVTPAHHRWAMTELAVDGIEYFEADRREVDREGWTYTIDTLTSFGEDERGELYVLTSESFGPSGDSGTVWRIRGPRAAGGDDEDEDEDEDSDEDDREAGDVNSKSPFDD